MSQLMSPIPKSHPILLFLPTQTLLPKTPRLLHQPPRRQHTIPRRLHLLFAPIIKHLPSLVTSLLRLSSSPLIIRRKSPCTSTVMVSASPDAVTWPLPRRTRGGARPSGGRKRMGSEAHCRSSSTFRWRIKDSNRSNDDT